MNMKLLFIALACLLLGSCTNYKRADEDSAKVRLYFQRHVVDKVVVEDFRKQCQMLGDVIGSEGHWYNYLLYSNAHLIQGALNDLRNNAHSMGANTVIVFNSIDFTTSVTFVGEAYNCVK